MSILFNKLTLKISKVLTQGGGAGGFLKLIGGGGEGSGKISEILIGLAKSFFAMKMGKNKALQDWGSAGAESNQNDDNVGKWTDSLIGGRFICYILLKYDYYKLMINLMSVRLWNFKDGGS